MPLVCTCEAFLTDDRVTLPLPVAMDGDSDG
jgi:hypothetical protein